MVSSNLDTSSWLAAFQADSILASYNSDCLQHIFSLLSLPDALHIGRACRRLYVHFESQKRTRALVITRDHPCGLEKHKAVFLRNINGAARDAVEEKVLKATLTPVWLPFSSSASGAPLLTFTHKFTDTFTNLHLLEVATRLNGAEWADLLGQLNPASLPLLTTLKLYPEFCDFQDARLTAKFVSDNFWAPLLHRLRHPALRHLTLNILNRFAPYGGLELTVSPPLPILQQLTTFSFFSRQSMPALLELVEEFTRPPVGMAAHPTLTPGEGARFGLQLFKDLSAVEEVPLVPSLLSYITYLDLQIGWNISNHLHQETVALQAPLKSLWDALGHMDHLQKLDLTIGRDGEGRITYPTFLAALSRLEHLRVLSVNCLQNPLYGDGFSREWTRSEMRVLPSVSFLSLALSTSVHSDVVEQFHLAHCFPGLRRIKVHFRQDSCSDHSCFGDWLGDRLAKYQACGRELTRGLLALKLSQTKEPVLEKGVTFTFDELYRFSSLEKLLAGIKN
ncbi:hypothetical protein TYRP_019441 [Tyrophagus putrescentiae]|nr:hypothetical protein TYRP_019441 [Tyrophagus putrescentiae]